MGQIHNYRQPMVTAIGIFLGFMLNYATHWISDAFTKYVIRDIIIGTSTTLCIALLMVVLYRMLNMRYPADKVEAFYQKTLSLFLIAISLPFISFLIVLIYRLMNPTAFETVDEP